MMNSTTARYVLRRAIVARQCISNMAAPMIRTKRTKTTTTAPMITQNAYPPAATATTTTTTKQTIRSFGTPAKKVSDSSPTSTAVVTDTHSYEKLVEESIKKLMMTTNRDDAQEDLKPISNGEFEIRIDYFKKVFEEAELCLSDLRETLFEADDEQYREEIKCAEGAVNNAFTAYIDLLEDLRSSSEEQLSAFSEVRNNNACNLRRLRNELDKIIEVAENRVRASS
mmetsp:Transcript_4159/g.9392  ORF Transcript_4159/g.9392 Transcript_4159/m.9392 type:complete len:226 (+) Transcript_4159:374-1051(+)